MYYVLCIMYYVLYIIYYILYIIYYILYIIYYILYIIYYIHTCMTTIKRHYVVTTTRGAGLLRNEK